jgi:ATP-dependent helicase HrpA
MEAGAARQRLAPTTADVRAQLDGLLRPGFVADTGLARLPHLQRYLRAMLQRLDKAATNPREAQLQEQVDAVETAYADLLDDLPATSGRAPEVTDIAWMIEELRVSLFAQSLGTAHPVSEKRVRNAIAAVARAGNPSAARHV